MKKKTKNNSIKISHRLLLKLPIIFVVAMLVPSFSIAEGCNNPAFKEVDESSLTITSSPNVELLVTNPDGDATGMAKGQIFAKIPRSSYGLEEGIEDDEYNTNGDKPQSGKVLEVLKPKEGIYQVKVTAVTSGEYSFEVSGTGSCIFSDGGKISKSGYLLAGDAYKYEFEYTPNKIKSVVNIVSSAE